MSAATLRSSLSRVRGLSPRLRFSSLRPRQTQTHAHQPRRHATSSSNGPSSSPSSTAQAEAANTTASSRAARIIARLPRSLRPYAQRLRDAPVSHVAAFLVLHEATAVVPLVGLAALFHYSDTAGAPVRWMAEHYGGYVGEGVARFERYFRRKGWFGFGEGGEGGEGEEEHRVEGQAGSEKRGQGEEGTAKGGRAVQDALRRWGSGDAKYRIVMEVALSYAIVKALLPVRILASLWATPWFAGVLGSIRRIGTRRKGA